MFNFNKKWRNTVLIEGQKEAEAIARLEGLPAVNPDFDDYPVDITLKGKVSFVDAVKKAVVLSNMNIYNMFYRVEN